MHTFPYEGALQSLSISSNGQYLAAGNLDGSVHLWSLSTEQNWHMGGYPCKVGHVVFDPYGESLWTAAGPDLVTWSAQNFEGSSGQPLDSHLGWIQAIACHPRQRVVATVGEDGLLCLWEPGKAKPRVSQELRVSGGLSCVAWSPTDVCLAVGADDGTVELFACGRRGGEMMNLFGGPAALILIRRIASNLGLVRPGLCRKRPRSW